jgi:hypothetical protein
MAERSDTRIQTSKKTCFVICPIGDDGSNERKWSDDLLECIISPVVEKMGYLPPIRADKISESGIITRQIVDLLIDSDLVIADLSYRNPNVCYELAVRHVAKKPFIHMIRTGHKIPFDTASNRAILVDLDIRSAKKAMEDLEHHISSIKNGNFEMDNPIGTALTLRDLKSSGDPSKIISADLMESLQGISSEVRMLRNENSYSSRYLEECRETTNQRSPYMHNTTKNDKIRNQLDLLNQYFNESRRLRDLKAHNSSKKAISMSEHSLMELQNKLINYGVTEQVLLEQLDSIKKDLEK